MLEAARYLSTTELCKQQKVVLSEEWNSSVGSNDAVDLIVNPNDKLCTDTIPDEGDIFKNETFVDATWCDLFENIDEFIKQIDEWDETKNDLPINPGSLDTLSWSNDNMLLKLAPGKGKTPLNISIRSSPAFWQQKQQELMSMIRQLGRPTFSNTFIS